MQDVGTSEAGSPAEIEDDNGDEEEGTPALESEPASAPTTPVPELVVRKKRLG